MDKLWRNRDWLREHYIAQEKSTVAVAKEAGCSYVAINKWLHRYEIPVRSRGEGQFFAVRNSVVIIPDLLRFLGGEIIGDGHVRMTSNYSALYAHSSKYREYLAWLSERFDKWGIKQVGRIREYKDKRTGAIFYHYTSRSYPELVPIYKHWYPNGKKTVPEDLKLTPIMARQWYIGDGSLGHPERGRPYIYFSTHDFDIASVNRLIKELQKQGFKATRWPSNNRIGLSRYSTKDFLSWIGPCPISCYDYKWAYEKQIR